MSLRCKKNSTSGWTCNENVSGYVIVCTSQFEQMLALLWCHTDGIIQNLVVDIEEYIGIHDIGDSKTSIYTELDIPKAATGEYNNVVILLQR